MRVADEEDEEEEGALEGKKGMKCAPFPLYVSLLSELSHHPFTRPPTPNRHAPPSQPFSQNVPFSDGEADSLLIYPLFSK